MISTFINVIREDEEITVYISGQTEFQVSPNPLETGETLVDWSVDSPRFFELTKAEQALAEQALVDRI